METCVHKETTLLTPTTTLTNSGTAYLLLELSSGSTYNGNVTFNNTSTQT